MTSVQEIEIISKFIPGIRNDNRPSLTHINIQNPTLAVMLRAWRGSWQTTRPWSMATTFPSWRTKGSSASTTARTALQPTWPLASGRDQSSRRFSTIRRVFKSHHFSNIRLKGSYRELNGVIMYS